MVKKNGFKNGKMVKRQMVKHQFGQAVGDKVGTQGHGITEHEVGRNQGQKLKCL